MATIKPLGKRVLIRRCKAETSRGGILLPDTAKEKPQEGEVLAVGPGERKESGGLTPVTLNIGDRVLFSTYSGTQVKGTTEEDEYMILSEDDVLGVLR
jgi:chaperonin GroES